MVWTLVPTIPEHDYLVSLEHFINTEKLCLYQKWSRLMSILNPDFSSRWRPISPDFEGSNKGSTSLDRFI